MKLGTTFVVAAALIASALPSAAEGMSKAEIATLPQDKVRSIKEECERKWANDFRMRVYCEDKQYKALKFYLDRNS